MLISNLVTIMKGDLEKNKMNLLIISTVDLRKTGIPVSIMNNYRLFNHSDIHCTFVTYGVDKSYEDEIIQNGDKIFILPNRMKKPIAYMRKLREIVNSKKYNLAHVHGNSSTMVMELLVLKGQVKVICQAHNTNCVHSTFHKILYPLFIRLVEEKTACTEAAGKFLYRKHKFKVLKNGIETAKYSFSSDIRKKFRDSMGIGENFAILHVGGFSEQKNHDFLLEVFKKYHEKNPLSQLWLIGEGVKKESIINLVHKNKLDQFVKFIGRTNDVSKYMMAADCFLLPSLYESFGIVNIEAQATGLPCVVSTSVPDVAKISDYFYKVPLDDASKWLEAIDKCQKITIQRRNSSLNVFEHGFDVSQTSKELINYYKSL